MYKIILLVTLFDDNILHIIQAVKQDGLYKNYHYTLPV